MECVKPLKLLGSFDLVLPSGLIIILDKCHFASTITRSVVSIYRLVDNGYIHTFTNYGISVSKDNVFYFNAIPRDGIYKIDMHSLYPNVSSMFNVSNKRAKHALDSSYLWHCRLGHINKKRIDKLQRDGILQLTHDELLKKCKSTFGKMAWKPFPHQVERAKDLLGLIHTDVCDPFRTVSREGASYFITFTDDFSRYGYVYLMKHKHEVFETFKVFPNEVENQLGKKIKAILSDRRGEYLSHEFVNHMKSYGYPKEMMGYYFYYPLENKIFVAQNAKFFENSLMVQEASRSHGLLESRIPQAPDRYGFYVDVEEYELGNLNKPPNYKAALSDPESDKWLEAVNTKMSKWLFKKKTDMDDTRSIRILLAIAVLYDYEIWQMDVKTTFMNGHLSEDQASRIWNKRFDVEIKKIGFTQNPDEPCVYLKSSGSNVAFLILYVDDILLMRNNVTMLQEVKAMLCKCFSIKDLGEAAYILGIKIIHDRSKWLIALSQSAYLEKTLKKFRMENSKKGYTPIIEKPDYRKS
ncbi:retrotransposon protein, putative, ty1-copia subclass [Tanacetum coccineum]